MITKIVHIFKIKILGRLSNNYCGKFSSLQNKVRYVFLFLTNLLENLLKTGTANKKKLQILFRKLC